MYKFDYNKFDEPLIYDFPERHEKHNHSELHCDICDSEIIEDENYYRFDYDNNTIVCDNCINIYLSDFRHTYRK